jgi:hypothetical protein
LNLRHRKERQMKSTVLCAAAGTLLTMTVAAAAQPGAAPAQCWSNGVAVPCAPPAANYSAAPRQYPPSWYYSPYDAPQFHCRTFNCGGGNG